ncbi:unnamed protein product [Euphydryas editha]|uniref:BZIP domain-containing protein n=1 Tax=Euphydryas editha TaxID=104508 RepID=A0AAU9TZH2_EUPED|nr:unnamed protein product [Euphydryas editha]
MYSERQGGERQVVSVLTLYARAHSVVACLVPRLQVYLPRDNKFVSRSLQRALALGSRPMPANVHVPFGRQNIFQNWLEEKVELPIFENISQVPERVDLPQPVQVPVPSASYPPQTVPQPTEDLLREFETVYGAVELTHLTPPQSPPGPATQLLLSYAQQAQCASLPSALQLAPVSDQWQVTPAVQPEYDCDSQALEELVRHRAAQLASPQPSPRSVSPSPRSSPRSSPPSSPRSSTDEEWSASSRPKPYSRNVDDRRSRKKEQNKNAATRYRQKKKAEVEVLLNEEQALRKRHVELGDKCSDLQREIRYLKGLMRDLFKAKGLIK